jgi:predicted extracellular nuclease
VKVARLRLGACVVVALVGGLVGAMPTGASSSGIVISQVYGGGGNTGATFKNDFIEVFNAGATAVNLTGWSVQYASSAGTTWQQTSLSGTLGSGQYFLVQEAAGAGGVLDLPTPDATGVISMSASAGKIALVSNTTLLSGSCPLGTVDLVGYGTTDCFEGVGPAPTLSNTTAALRSNGGCTDTDANSADFVAGGPNPRNTASAPHFCGPDDAPSVTATNPTDGAIDVAVNTNLTITFSEAVNVTGEWFGIFCVSSGGHTAGVTGGPTTFTLDPATDFSPGEACAVTVKASNVTDQDANDPPDNMAGPFTFTFTTGTALPTPHGVVVSQVYGGGGNTGATFKNDFVELFNRGDAAVNLDGWTVQYASSAGTTWAATSLTNLTLQPLQYYLVQEAEGAGGAVDLPAPDAAGTIAMSATAGKVALVGNATLLSGSCPASATIADFVGYGVADCFEGVGAAPAPSNTTADLRGGNGCVDTDNNAADFATGTPNPRNTASPLGSCDDQPPSVTSTIPASAAVDVAVDANITVQFSEPVNVAEGWYSISCATSGSHTAAATGSSQSFTLNPDTDIATNQICTVTVLATNVTDQDTVDPPDTMSGDYVWSFTTTAPPPPPVAIHDIQGAAHTSPKVGQSVSNVNGTVTAKKSNGFYMQDPAPDADDATSEGIFVFTSSAPASVNVGDAVRVNGNVTEFRAGGSLSTNLTITEIGSPTISVLSSGNPLPATTVVGSGGRVPPGEVIEDDAAGSVETSGTFDPASDGIDFYESLEGMRVQVNNPVTVGPTNSFGEVTVLGDNGANAAVRTARGGIVIRANDFNPERIQLDNAILAGSTPQANVGDHFSGAAVGVLDYDFGNFELNLTEPLTTVSGGLAREATAPQGPKQIAIATFNVENLDPADGPAKFNTLAGLIVNNLKSPDVIALEEVQDNNGAVNDAITDANVTLDTLAAAVQAAGGPAYSWRQINPVDDQDGGEPGGNIRVAFFFRSDRGVEFIDRAGGGPTIATTVVSTPSGPQLSASPGRIDPTNTAWNSSRKPLAAEFKIRNRTFFMIANHFNSKGGDQPLFGRFQPPQRISEVQRNQQAQVENNFVDQILAADPNANIVTLGDFNDFEFSDALQTLRAGGVLDDMIETLPQEERYSYVFEGNSQSLDHILASNAVVGLPFEFDEVHVNAEFADQSSDHDPSVLRLSLNSPPKPKAGGPYSVDEGGQVVVSATADDPDGDAVTYAWDLDGNGTFETPGQTVTFAAGSLDGPGTKTISVQATDSGGLLDTDDATVDIVNVAPTASLSAPATTFAGFPFTIALTGASDPSAADTTAGFMYAFDCGDGSGYGSFGSASSASCATAATATRTVAAKIQDKDGGVSEYSATVRVVVTFDSLCALVRAYSSDPSVADMLCAKLADAAAASTATARAGHLNAFRNQVDAKTGKAFTPEQAAVLKLLSTSL